MSNIPVFTQEQVNYLNKVFGEDLTNTTYDKLLQKQGSRLVVRHLQTIVDNQTKARTQALTY